MSGVFGFLHILLGYEEEVFFGALVASVHDDAGFCLLPKLLKYAEAGLLVGSDFAKVEAILKQI